MKKYLQIILINIFVFVGILLIFDILLAYNEYNNYLIFLDEGRKNNKDALPTYNNPHFKYTLIIPDLKKYVKKEYEDLEERVYIGQNSKKAIWVFGCSFAQGALLNYNQKFEYKLYEMVDGGGEDQNCL